MSLGGRENAKKETMHRLSYQQRKKESCTLGRGHRRNSVQRPGCWIPLHHYYAQALVPVGEQQWSKPD